MKNFRKFKEGLIGKKLKHHQTVGRPKKGNPGSLRVAVPTPRERLPILYFDKFYSDPLRKAIFPKYWPKSQQNICKTARNVDMWDGRKDFWLLKTWTRYLH